MLNHTPVVFIVVVGGMLISAWLWMRLLPSAKTLGEAGSGRFATLDGVRGVAAASVFAGHAATSMDYVRTGVWDYGTYPLYLWATEGAVAVFFMLTGFLFWSKALKGGIKVKPHLLSRVRRIYPIYVLSSLLIFAMVAVYSGFQLKVSLTSLLLSLAEWTTGGFLKVESINGQGLLTLNDNVLWTLQYEWTFYLLLPLLALFFAKRTGLMAVFYAALVVSATLLHWGAAKSTLLVGLPLLCGCLTAAWLRDGRYVPNVNSRISVSIAIGLLVLSVVCFRARLATVDIVCLMWPLFSLIAAGCNPGGFLTRPSMTFMGKISYGVYMMHGILLCVIQRQWGWFESHQPIAFLGFLLVAIFFFSGWCQWVFRRIEEPYIHPRVSRTQLSSFKAA